MNKLNRIVLCFYNIAMLKYIQKLFNKRKFTIKIQTDVQYDLWKMIKDKWMYKEFFRFLVSKKVSILLNSWNKEISDYLNILISEMIVEWDKNKFPLDDLREIPHQKTL